MSTGQQFEHQLGLLGNARLKPSKQTFKTGFVCLGFSNFIISNEIMLCFWDSVRTHHEYREHLMYLTSFSSAGPLIYSHTHT
jgi:hypothetical protein